MNSLQAGCFISVAQSTPQFNSTKFIYTCFSKFIMVVYPHFYQRNLSKASTNSMVGGGLQESTWAQ